MLRHQITFESFVLQSLMTDTYAKNIYLAEALPSTCPGIQNG